jgi:myo-inositol-1(or 4)-monophosphatase
MSYERERDVAQRAAREAGQLALQSLGQPGYQQWKGHGDVLVGAVLPIQDHIIQTIRAEFPHDAILAEESDDIPPLDADRLWIIDPIDGSLNFMQGIPHFSIAIALRAEGIFRVGVVYAPATHEMFHALQGQYARLNDEPITVQLLSEGEDAYHRAIVGTDVPGDLQRRQESLNIATLLGGQAVTLNAMGSPALGLCYVACGRYHAYYHTALKPWDVAAAAVILGESGGILTDILGGSWLHSTGGCIATNGIIHGWMVRAAKAVLERHNRQ